MSAMAIRNSSAGGRWPAARVAVAGPRRRVLSSPDKTPVAVRDAVIRPPCPAFLRLRPCRTAEYHRQSPAPGVCPGVGPCGLGQSADRSRRSTGPRAVLRRVHSWPPAYAPEPFELRLKARLAGDAFELESWMGDRRRPHPFAPEQRPRQTRTRDRRCWNGRFWLPCGRGSCALSPDANRRKAGPTYRPARRVPADLWQGKGVFSMRWEPIAALRKMKRAILKVNL